MAYHHRSGSGRAMYSNTDDCYDGGKHGGMRAYSRTDEYYDDVDRRRPGAYADDCSDGAGYGARQTAVYSDEYSRSGNGNGYGYGYGCGGEQEHFKREEKEHKHKERLGEVGAIAGGAFALYEGHRAKKDPANAQRHKIKANVIMEHSELICCKLYISENRNSTVIDAIDDAARSDPNNVVVLSKFGDSIYNRVRYTLVSYIISESNINASNDGETVSTINKVTSPIREVLLKMVETAFNNTNLTENSGTHPRMGVIDDLSFHPLGDAKMEDAAWLARLVASDIGDPKHKVPVFLYGAAHPERKTLGAIRRELGYYNNINNTELLEILNKTTPDNAIVKKENDNTTNLVYARGATTVYARGATTVGAAPFLEGYNVPLRYKDDIKRVRSIVKKLRKELGGGREGLPKFLAMELPHGECIEIGCLFDANHLRADQVQDKVREIAVEQGLEDKVEKGYYTDITKEMILVNLYSKLFSGTTAAPANTCTMDYRDYSGSS